MEGGLYICLLSESNGPNMLDETFERLHSDPCRPPLEGVKRLATSGERVNHDSWVKMFNLCRVFKTSILVVLMVTSGLGDMYIKGDDSYCVKILIVYYLMLYIIYVTLIIRLWNLYNLIAILVEFDMDSLLLFPPYFSRSLGL